MPGVRKPGEECKLYYDTTLTVDPGDIIETSTGRRYLVTAARKSPTRRQRWNLNVLVMAPGAPYTLGATVHMLHWYSRSRKPRTKV